MIIKDVLSLAVHGELSGVAAKKDNSVIVAFINMGLLELYKRFPIKVEEHIINLVDGVSYYEMPTNFMYSLEAWGEARKENPNQDVPIGINNEDDPNSIFFNDWNTVQVPASVEGSYISLLYSAKPAPITLVQAEDGVTELDLPDTLLDALLSYVGYRGHIGVKSDAQTENNAHYARFERNCRKAIELGVAYPSDSMSMAERLSDRGFA